METTTQPSAAVSAHTPGPWFHTALGSHIVQVLGKSEGLSVEVARVGGGSRDESAANAQLVAAAPDLLKALREVDEAVEWSQRNSKSVPSGVLAAVIRARAVIAAATGK